MNTTSPMNPPLLETIQNLQGQAERLEHEAALLRRALARVAESLADPRAIVACYDIEGEHYEITRGEIDALQRRMIKLRTQETLHELILAHKMAAQQPHRSRQEAVAALDQMIEASRKAAIADGTALDHEYEEALND
ncbi:MAG: hypothetical protein M3Q45_07295 [Chloroflexota bacterium]|nr:hypothetical protein [Chloroflexota bacterium]